MDPSKDHLRQAREASPTLEWEIEEVRPGLLALVGVRDGHTRHELAIQITHGKFCDRVGWTTWLQARTERGHINFTVHAATINASLGAARVLFQHECERRAKKGGDR